MGAGLERYIHRRLSKQLLILRTHCCKGIHFCVSLTTTDMIAFTDDASLILPPTNGGSDNYRSHHWVGLSVLPAIPGKLKAAPHVFLVGLLHKNLFAGSD